MSKDGKELLNLDVKQAGGKRLCLPPAIDIEYIGRKSKQPL